MSVKNDVKKSINFRIASALFLSVLLVASLGIYGKYVYDTGNIEFRIGGVLAETLNQFYKVELRFTTPGGQTREYTITSSQAEPISVPLGSRLNNVLAYINVSTAYIPQDAQGPSSTIRINCTLIADNEPVTESSFPPYGYYVSSGNYWYVYSYHTFYYDLNTPGTYTIELEAYTI